MLSCSNFVERENYDFHQGHELAKPEDIYNLLGTHMNSREQSVKVKVPYEHNHTSSKDLAQRLSTHGDFEAKGHKHIEVSKAIRRLISSDDIRRLSQALRHILHKYVDPLVNTFSPFSPIYMIFHFWKFCMFGSSFL